MCVSICFVMYCTFPPAPSCVLHLWKWEFLNEHSRSSTAGTFIIYLGFGKPSCGSAEMSRGQIFPSNPNSPRRVLSRNVGVFRFPGISHWNVAGGTFHFIRFCFVRVLIVKSNGAKSARWTDEVQTLPSAFAEGMSQLDFSFSK